VFLHQIGRWGLQSMRKLLPDVRAGLDACSLPLWTVLPQDSRDPGMRITEVAEVAHYVCHELFDFSRGELVELKSEWSWYAGDMPTKETTHGSTTRSLQ